MIKTLRLKQMSDRQKDIQYVITDNGCWECISHFKDRTGYIQIRIKKEGKYLHRITYESFYKEIPSGFVIMHTCDNPSCINPDHLRVATQKENLQDMALKGRARFAKGESNSNAKLKEEDVLKIRKMRATHTATKLAQIFNVTQPTISFICSGKLWKHVK